MRSRHAQEAAQLLGRVGDRLRVGPGSGDLGPAGGAPLDDVQIDRDFEGFHQQSAHTAGCLPGQALGPETVQPCLDRHRPEIAQAMMSQLGQDVTVDLCQDLLEGELARRRAGSSAPAIRRAIPLR